MSHISPKQSASIEANVTDQTVTLTITGENPGDFAEVTMGVGTTLNLVRTLQAAAAEASINAMLADTKTNITKGSASE